MVIDASAILAVLGNEPGHEVATRHMRADAVVSVVNAGEVLGKLVWRGMEPETAERALDALGLSWIAPDADQARRVGELGAIKDLSLADRFCIALGEARGETLVTGDRDWAKIEINTAVEFFR